MTNIDFKTLLWRAGFHTTGRLDRKAAMAFLHIKNVRTLERWLAGAEPCPRAVAMLQTRIAGNIPQDDNWRGFFICRQGYLNTPDGHRYEAEYIKHLQFVVSAAHSHESQVHNLKREIVALKRLVFVRERINAIGEELTGLSGELLKQAALEVYRNQG